MAHLSTQADPTAHYVTGTSTKTDASSPRRPSLRPAARWSHCAAGPRAALRCLSVWGSHQLLGRRGRGQSATRWNEARFSATHGGGSWHPEGDRLRTGGRWRGPDLGCAYRRAERKASAVGPVRQRDRLQHRRQPSGDRRALRQGDHARPDDSDVGRSRDARRAHLRRGCGPRQPHGSRPHRPAAASFWLSSSPAGRWSTWSPARARGRSTRDQRVVIAFSPDGLHAAVGGWDGEVLVVDLDTGEPLRPPVFLSHKTTVLSLAYSADGRQFVTSAADSSVALWNGRLVSWLRESSHRSAMQRPRSSRAGNRCSSPRRARDQSTNGTPASSTPSSSPAAWLTETSPRSSGRRCSAIGPINRSAPRERQTC